MVNYYDCHPRSCSTFSSLSGLLCCIILLRLEIFLPKNVWHAYIFSLLQSPATKSALQASGVSIARNAGSIVVPGTNTFSQLNRKLPQTSSVISGVSQVTHAVCILILFPQSQIHVYSSSPRLVVVVYFLGVTLWNLDASYHEEGHIFHTDLELQLFSHDCSSTWGQGVILNHRDQIIKNVNAFFRDHTSKE